MSHDYHDPRNRAIFHDGCAECEHKAKDPIVHLDRERMAKLWHTMIDVEISDVRAYESESDAIAGRQVYRVFLFLQRFTTTDPKLLTLYAPSILDP